MEIDLKVKKESLPKRCDICHKTDTFNQQTGYCSCCVQVQESLNKADQAYRIDSSNNVAFGTYFTGIAVGAFTSVVLNFLLFSSFTLFSRLTNNSPNPIPQYYFILMGTIWVGNYAAGNYAAFQYFFNRTSLINNKANAFIISIMTVGIASFSHVLFLLIKGHLKNDPFHAGEWVFVRFLLLSPIWIPLAGVLGLVTRYGYWLRNRSKCLNSKRSMV
ncbi:MAG: hypothetical protein WAQ98_00930 [Blastocatellia bacterium]